MRTERKLKVLILGALVFASLFVVALIIERDTDSPTSEVEQTISSALQAISPISIQETEKLKVDVGSNIYATESILFPNGEKVAVKYISYVPPVSTVEKKKALSEMYDKLVAAAEDGDVGSAALLGNDLVNCLVAPRTKYEYEARSEELNEGVRRSLIPGRDPELRIPVDPDRIGIYSANLLEAYERCAGITDAQLESHMKWLTLASKGGDIGSTNTLHQILGNTQEAYALLKDGWDVGNVGNGYALALLNTLGIHGREDGQADYITAYAYGLATNLIWSRAYEINNSPYSANRIVNMENGLQRTIGYALSPQEVLEAEEIAAQLIRNNPRCCVGSWENYGLNVNVK